MRDRSPLSQQRPARGRAIVSLALGLAALTCVGAAAQDAAGGAFTADERRRLIGGELVRRPTTSRQGRFDFIGGTSYARVAAPQDEVWAAINEVSNLHRLVPGLAEARLVEERGGERIVFMRHQMAFVSASYFARVRAVEATRTMHFELDRSRPHDVRAGRGFVTVDRFRGDESIVTWGVRADVGQGLLTGVFAPVIHDWILKVPDCVRGHMRGVRTC